MMKSLCLTNYLKIGTLSNFVHVSVYKLHSQKPMLYVYLMQQVDILISKNQVLQILYLKNCVYKTT